MHLLHNWFGWPDGSVLTNLVASAICFAAGWWFALRKHVKALHKKLDKVHSHLGIEE
jgi:hypothetical protein